MNLRKLSALLGVVGSAFLLAGSTATAAGEEIVVESLPLSSAEPFRWIDHSVAYFTSSWLLGYATCLKLVNYDEESGQLVPDAAVALPAVSGDAKTYSFTVATGHAFSDPGAETVTPLSFKRAIERATSPTMALTPGGAPARSQVRDVVGAQAFFDGTAGSISGVQPPAAASRSSSSPQRRTSRTGWRRISSARRRALRRPASRWLRSPRPARTT